MRIVIVRQAHVAQLAVIRARHDGQEMMIFRYALDAVARELERAELQLAFHDVMKFTGVSKERLQELQPVKEMPEAYLGKTSYWT